MLVQTLNFIGGFLFLIMEFKYWFILRFLVQFGVAFIFIKIAAPEFELLD